MKKVYYAHSMHLYGTPQEKRDIEVLESLSFEVVNPADEYFVKMCDEVRRVYGDDYDKGSEAIMEKFMNIVDGCDAVAFRAHIDGRIPSGVGKEVKRAIVSNKAIIELPSLTKSKFLDKEETRQYLQLNGQR